MSCIKLTTLIILTSKIIFGQLSPLKTKIEKTFIENYSISLNEPEFDTIIKKIKYYKNGSWELSYLKNTSSYNQTNEKIATIILDSNERIVNKKLIYSDSTYLFSKTYFGKKYITEKKLNEDSILVSISLFKNKKGKPPLVSFHYPMKMRKDNFIHTEYNFKKWLFGIIQTRTFYQTYYEKQEIWKSIKLFRTKKHYSIENGKKNLVAKEKYRNGKLYRMENIIDEYTKIHYYKGKDTHIIENWVKGDLKWKETIKTEYK